MNLITPSRWAIYLVFLLNSLIMSSPNLPCVADEQNTTREQTLAKDAYRKIATYHRGQPKSNNRVQVVYFYAKDRDPLPNWKERLNRILMDVEEFYEQGIEAVGISDASLRFEQSKGEYVFHLVQGKANSEQYNYESGSRVVAEIETALQGKLDLNRNHLLIIHGLCEKDEQGRFKFHAPYYGFGSAKRGICHAADCELLDPQNLVIRDQKIVYSEHYYSRKEQTLGRFNSWYIGGIAHELGHGLGLPHDAGPRSLQRSASRIALMGTGNHHYREELHSDKQGAYLSIGSILRLLSHPIVTQSDRGRFEAPKTQINSLAVSQKPNFVISGRATGDIPPYAVIAYLWRPNQWPGNPRNDHRSASTTASINEGSFRLQLPILSPGDYRLRLSVLHCNGASTEYDHHLVVKQGGNSNLDELPMGLMIMQAEKMIKNGDLKLIDFGSLEEPLDRLTSSSIATKLRVLKSIANPTDPIDLSQTQLRRIALSDAKWESANVGWGQVKRNHYDLKNNLYLTLKDEVFEKGLYAHSKSEFTFKLDGGWTSLSATIGLQQGAQAQGSAVFRVLGDGRELYRSPVMKTDQSASFSVDLTDVIVLKLITDGGEGHVHNSWAIWANPILTR